MTFETKEAKDGNKTCLIDGFFLHSSYKPAAEAEKFVSTLTFSFIPKYIVITEPGFSYAAEYLKKTFCDSEIICIRYCSYFQEYDSLWDKVIYYDGKLNLSDELFNLMNEEGISECLFVSWKPSEKIFNDISQNCWNEIKKAVLKSRQVLATRTYFSKKWFINSVRNSLFINNTYGFVKTDKPVIVCASGKSLKGCIDFIKSNENKFHIFCVSSAYSVLMQNDIVPELCICTDGGFYAKKHVSFKASCCDKTIFALPCEAALDSKFLSECKILPLSYNDCPGDDFFNAVGLKTVNALRNGTVSGTAVFLSLMITTSDVYVCGLDLSENNGFAHTQPNELELTDSLRDSFFTTKETRIVPQTFKNESLEVYREWFNSTDFGKRLYRLSNNYCYKNKLFHVPDVNLDFIENKNYSEFNENNFYATDNSIDISSRSSIIFKLIKQNLNTEKYIKNILPAKAILIERCKNKEEKEKLSKDISDSMNEFLESVNTKIFNKIMEQ